MSRRAHHPARRHPKARHPETRRPSTTRPTPSEVVEVVEVVEVAGVDAAAEGIEVVEVADTPVAEPEVLPADPVEVAPATVAVGGEPEAPAPEPEPPEPEAPAPSVARAPVSPPTPSPSGPPGAATAPQLRRFIKSRPYIPMHELRRRFGINVEDDDVSVIDLDGHRLWVGLPAREGSLLGELLRSGDIGYEASVDPIAPVIVGVFPIRPVTRT